MALSQPHRNLSNQDLHIKKYRLKSKHNFALSYKAIQEILLENCMLLLVSLTVLPTRLMFNYGLWGKRGGMQNLGV